MLAHARKNVHKIKNSIIIGLESYWKILIMISGCQNACKLPLLYRTTMQRSGV